MRCLLLRLLIVFIGCVGDYASAASTPDPNAAKPIRASKIVPGRRFHDRSARRVGW